MSGAYSRCALVEEGTSIGDVWGDKFRVVEVVSCLQTGTSGPTIDTSIQKNSHAVRARARTLLGIGYLCSRPSIARNNYFLESFVLLLAILGLGTIARF